MCVSPFRTGAERLHAAGTLRSLGPSGLFGFDLGGGRRTLAAVGHRCRFTVSRDGGFVTERP